MTTNAPRGVIPEFAQADIEQDFRQWSLPDTVRQARAALWVAVFALPLFVINDIRLLGIGPAAAAQIALRAGLVGWSAMLLVRLRHPVDPGALQWHLLVWCVALDIQVVVSATSRPPDFTPMLMTNQTVLFALVVFCPMRFVVRAVNGAALAVALVLVLRITGTITSALVVPFSVSTTFALVAGLPLVRELERLRREEFARTLREQARMEQLRQAREAAEAADCAKTRFLAMVSHEIRTPMNGVLGVLQLLEGSRLDALQCRQVAIARDCAESLTGLLDALIDYARLGSAIEAPVAVDFDPRQWVGSAVDLMRPRATARRTVIRTQIGEDVPAVLHADVGKLQQVLINLLNNAVKFTEQGRIDVRLAQRFGEGGERRLELEVEDSGIGIAHAKLEGIFDEFVQADDSIARRFGGAGLGLAVCKRLVHLLGGSIVATSEMEMGSCFRVTIPVDVASAIATAEPVSPSMRRLRVLVVDDDPINQIVACGLLAQAGHDAMPVDNGEAACAEIAREHFDVVFMDLHMPVMDGFESARRIRALSAPGQNAMPIVALTADLLQARSAGFADLFSDVLAKPIRRDALRRVLATIGAERALSSRQPDGTWSTDALVDLVHLSEHIDALGAEAVARLVHRFRLAGRRELGDLREAAASGNATRIAELAHRFASSASALGLPRLRRFAERVEYSTRQGSLPDVAASIATLGMEFDRTFDGLRELAREARAARRRAQVPQLTVASSR